MNALTGDGAVSRRALWFGLLGGALAWTAHLMFAYAIAEFGCVGGWGHGGYLDISLVAWLEVLLTVVTAAVAAAATFVAYRCYLSSATAPLDSAASGSARDTDRYTAYVGLLSGSLFFFVILFESIPIFFYLRHC
jgi:hypothetical protein